MLRPFLPCSITLLVLLAAACTGSADSGPADSGPPSASTADSAVSAPADSLGAGDTTGSVAPGSSDVSGSSDAPGTGGLGSLDTSQPAGGASASLLDSTAVVRALYVNRWAAQSRNRMRSLIAMADTTVVNAFVLDMKDEFGLNFAAEDSTLRRNAGDAGRVPRLGELLDTLKAHDIVPIARIVVFKDSVAARL